MAGQVHRIQLRHAIRIDLLILEAQIGHIRSGTAAVAHMDVGGQRHGILIRPYHGDVEILVAQLYTVRHGDTGGSIRITVSSFGGLTEGIPLFNVRPIFVDDEIDLVAGLQPGGHCNKCRFGFDFLARPDVFGDLPLSHAFVACEHGDGGGLFCAGPDGHVAAVDEGDAGVHGRAGGQVIVAQVQGGGANGLTAHAEAQGIHAVLRFIGAVCLLGLEGVNRFVILICHRLQTGQLSGIVIGSLHLLRGLQGHQRAFRDDQQLIRSREADAQAVEGKAGGFIIGVQRAVPVGVIPDSGCLVGTPAVGLGVLNDIHIAHGKPGANTPGLAHVVILGQIDRVAGSAVFSLGIDGGDVAAAVHAEGDIGDNRRALHGGRIGTAQLIDGLTGEERDNTSGFTLASDTCQTLLGNHIGIAVHLKDEEGLRGRTEAVRLPLDLFVKVFFLADQSAQLTVQEPDVGEVGVPVGFRTAAAGVNAVVTVVLCIVHQHPQSDGAAGNGLAGVLSLRTDGQFLEAELFDGLFILPVGCQRRLCGGVSGIVVAVHLGQTGVLDLHAIINPILRRHPGNGVAASGLIQDGKCGIEALAVDLRAHPLHGHLVVGGGIILAVVKVAATVFLIIGRAVVSLIGIQQVIQFLIGVIAGLGVEHHIACAGGHIVHAVSIGVVGNDFHAALAAAVLADIHRNGLDLGVSACGIHGVDGGDVLIGVAAQSVIVGILRVGGVADPGNMDFAAVIHPGVEVQIAEGVVVQL